jgi:hypothetical protein
MNGKRNRVRILSILGVALILAGSVMAQKKSREERREEANARAVQGQVVGPNDQPASGAVVQLKDMRSLQVRSFITQEDGMYHFAGLRADIDYQVMAKSGDMTAGPKTLSIFDNRKEATINFKLEKK